MCILQFTGIAKMLALHEICHHTNSIEIPTTIIKGTYFFIPFTSSPTISYETTKIFIGTDMKEGEGERTKVLITNSQRARMTILAEPAKEGQRRRNSEHSIFTRASDTSTSFGGAIDDYGKANRIFVLNHRVKVTTPAKELPTIILCKTNFSFPPLTCRCTADLPPRNSTEITILSMKEGILSSTEDDCYPILRSDGRRAFSNGLNVKIKPSKKKKENKLILRDDDKRFIAVCSKEALENGFIYKIFSCRPILPGQKPAKKTSNSRMGLYEWAEVVGAPCALQYPMCVWDGTSFVPSYVGKRGISSRRFIFEQANRPAGLMERTRNNWKIEVAPNMDPCLILLFAAIVDDLNQEEREQIPQQSLRDVAMIMSGMMMDQKLPSTFNTEAKTAVLNGGDQALGLPSYVASMTQS